MNTDVPFLLDNLAISQPKEQHFLSEVYRMKVALMGTRSRYIQCREELQI
jgi:hypothetical protein